MYPSVLFWKSQTITGIITQPQQGEMRIRDSLIFTLGLSKDIQISIHIVELATNMYLNLIVLLSCCKIMYDSGF